MNRADILRPADEVPPGWKTVEGWMLAWKLSYSQTHRILSTALRDRTVRRKSFRVPMTNGVLRPIPHYSAAKTKAKA